jgi:hypothetical protein
MILTIWYATFSEMNWAIDCWFFTASFNPKA